MTAGELIGLSLRRGGTAATEYPNTADEFDALAADLAAECDRADSLPSAGHSGPEARGGIAYHGSIDGNDWRVDVIRP